MSAVTKACILKTLQHEQKNYNITVIRNDTMIVDNINYNVIVENIWINKCTY